MKIQKIGKIQLISGSIILTIALLISIFGFNFYIKSLTTSINGVSETWNFETKKYNNTEIEVMGHVMSDLSIMGLDTRNALPLFLTNCILLISLSIILILQGLVNINKE